MNMMIKSVLLLPLIVVTIQCQQYIRPINIHDLSSGQNSEFINYRPSAINNRPTSNRGGPGLSLSNIQESPSYQHQRPSHESYHVNEPNCVYGRKCYSSNKGSTSDNYNRERPNRPSYGTSEEYSSGSRRPDNNNNNNKNRPVNYKLEDLGPINDFAWKLMKYANNDLNFAICPMPVQYLLTYFIPAAAGTTKEEIQRATGTSGPEQMQWVTDQLLSNTAKKELKMSTAVFLHNHLSFKPDYKQLLQNNKIDIRPVDFSNPEAVGRDYRRWVAEKTKGVFSDAQLVYDLNTRMIMSSAVYFKGDWIYKLNPGKIEPFYVTPGRQIQVQMMNLIKKLQYGRLENGAEWIYLPYTSDDFMLVMLPSKTSTVDELINNMKYEELQASLRANTYANVTLTLPKFKIESKFSLIQALNKMGISQLFSPHAQLPNLLVNNIPIAISNVLQQSSIEVNEVGSIATSVTSIGAIALSLSPIPADVEFKVNRPFLTMIFDRRFTIPYFMAKVSHPQY